MQILSKDQFPTLMQVDSYIRGKEGWRSAMLHIPSQDRSILMTTPPNDIKTEKSRGEDRLGDPENRKRKCD